MTRERLRGIEVQWMYTGDMPTRDIASVLVALNDAYDCIERLEKAQAPPEPDHYLLGLLQRTRVRP